MSGRIDEFFKDKMSADNGFEFEQQYWEQAEAMLDGKKPKRKVWMWLLPIFLLGVVGSSLLIFGGNKELSAELKDVTTNLASAATLGYDSHTVIAEDVVTVSKNDIETSSNNIEAAIVAENSTTANKTLSNSKTVNTDNAETKVINIVSAKSKAAAANTQNLPIEEALVEKSRKVNFNPTLVLAGNSSNVLLTKSHLLTEQNKEKTKPETKITDKPTEQFASSISKTSLAFLPPINQSILTASTNHLQLTPLTSEEDKLDKEDKKLNAQEMAALKLPKLRSALVIDIYGGVGFKKTHFKAFNNTGEQLKKHREDNEVAKLSSIVGINLRYMLSKRISVGTGLQFDELREEVSYDLVNTEVEEYYHWKHFLTDKYTLTELLSPPGGVCGVLKPKYDTLWETVEDSVWTSEEINTTVENSFAGTNTMRFVDIPFIVGVHGKLGKKWGYDVFAGGSLGYLVSSSGYLPNSDLTDLQSVNENNLSFRRPVLSSFIQPGIHYNLSDHVNLNFSPRVKANLTPLLNHDNNYNQRLFGADLTIGMSYKF